MKKTYEIGGYVQIVQKCDISCSCGWSTVHPYNYKNGGKICKHIKQLLKILKNKK